METNKKSFNKERAVCYFGFTVEFIIMAFFYGFSAVRWAGSEYMTVAEAMLQSGIIMLVLIITSLFICIFFNSQTVEKKFLFMIGCIAISLGVLGYSELVMQNKLSYLDATYRSIQFFVGEFD